MPRHSSSRRRRTTSSGPAPSSSSGTRTPVHVDRLELPELRHAEIRTADVETSRAILEAMGFVFPGPGEAFEELGGTRPSLDP